MIIEQNYSRFIVYQEDTVEYALNKITRNKSRIIFVVSESGMLEGIISDGDIRRWLLEHSGVNLSTRVHQVMNRQCCYAYVKDDKAKIATQLSEKIIALPLLDNNHRVVAVALPHNELIQIEGHEISADSPSFLIAEIGNNHNGDIRLAKKLVDLAIVAGADCVKFQMRDLNALYQNAVKNNAATGDLGVQYTLDILKKFQLTTKELFQIFDYCKQQSITPLCTPWDEPSLKRLQDYGMPAYKVASADFTNYQLLGKIAQSGQPMICSTGMATEAEIKQGIRFIKKTGRAFILLHCNSTYPAPFKDINLNYMNHLSELGDCLVGYSGHERDIHVPVAAVALGAKVIEKHFTIDRSMEGNDHKVSLLPDEFAKMVEGIRQVELAVGDSRDRQMTQGEMMNRENLAKSIIAAENIEQGTIITSEMVEIKSPGQGLQPNRIEELIGIRANKTYAKGDVFFAEDLSAKSAAISRKFTFSRSWGIPVRYHDAEKLTQDSNLKLLEIHLSYKDLDIDFRRYIQQPYNLDLVVHAPELFANDHTLNLCSEDEQYRQRSITELQRVIDLSLQLKPYFKQCKTPRIVTNVGGFSSDGHYSEEKKQQLYALLEDSLSCLDSRGVEIIPQSMPPFPWHFGGQQFHNLFMDAETIVRFCQRNKMRICLDISHSKLACNYFKWSFSTFIKKVAPFVTHLHLADAKGSDGEGLQIDQGDIDWRCFFQLYTDYFPHSSFIPEIWQGHKNNGEGCWTALSLLQEYDNAVNATTENRPLANTSVNDAVVI